MPDLNVPTVPGNPNLPDWNLPEWNLPGGNGDIELPEWLLPELQNPELPPLPELPEWMLPEMPNFQLPQIDLTWYPEWVWDVPEYVPDNMFADGEKAFDEIYVVDGPTGSFVIRQFPANLSLLSSYALHVGGMHENQVGELGEPPSINTTYKEEPRGHIQWIPQLNVVIPELPEFLPPQFDFEDWLNQWIKDNWGDISLNKPELNVPDLNVPDLNVPDLNRPGGGSGGSGGSGGGIVTPGWDIDDVIDFPDIGDITDQFPGHVKPDTIPGTDIEVVIPNTNRDLYLLLMRYIQELYSLQHYYANVTSITQYQANSIAVQNIRKSTPLAEYRWEVTGDNGTIESHTTSPLVKLLFRSAGTYTVRVYNTQSVIRNTKVSGVKQEIWLLSNNDFFDGMVIYKHSTSFSGYIGEDIGPTEEEIELKKDGFIANITPQMVNKIQFMDTTGNIRTPADGFTTERN